ncbi:hypothetical protein NPS01_37440 [Nocardioides psychrotolerans]|uniref:Uncharacterized protein n=1 Tax=Nocardioides psychrotolerans TaxID=1005945 RepID=A0A1I3QHS9_9ACTN|nr:hypothetical protein [Nocardioides psychrotolerans]GEP40081.1 hypothetical protein NPS01_37440 [Nocardioides psychrotolerans]SFJ32746.1 hypothetical protein SAMN05216561_12516 [Nocardioides psychrotolerans]
MTYRTALTTALATVLAAAALALAPATASGADQPHDQPDARAALPTKRLVNDRGDRDTQVVDATRMIVRSAPEQGRRATVSVAVPDGLVAGSQVVFHLNTDLDPTPEIAYFGAVSSEFRGYRMKSWTTTGAELPLTCGRLSAAIDETRARLAFNPLCINRNVRSFGVSFHLVAASGVATQDDWLPAPRTFSGRVKAFAA